MVSQTDSDRPPIDLLARPIWLFARHKLAGAGLLLAATILALIWANSPLGDLYQELLHTKLSVGFGEFAISKSLQHWINDGLMGVFFFVVGLEIKREFLAGSLATPRKAALPIAGAIGGMVFPALIYVVFNFGGPGSSGWAIPMATDIAFCLGVLAVLGDRVPTSLKVFLTALAIVDDIGAIVVIALFYTADISMVSLALGGLILVVSMGANKMGVRSSIFYFALGTLTWLAFVESGVHATLAAVLMAFTIPAKTRIDPSAFVNRVSERLEHFRSSDSEALTDGTPFLTSSQQHSLDDLNLAIGEVLPPVQKLEHALLPVVTFLVLPIFALANAGLRLEPAVIGELGNPVALGIMAGLFFGKQIGVFSLSWIAVKVGLATLPEDLKLTHVYGGGILSGIGFTMSLFISGLAFTDPILSELSKMSILLASLAAATYGYAVLRFAAPHTGSTEEEAPAPTVPAAHAGESFG